MQTFVNLVDDLVNFQRVFSIYYLLVKIGFDKFHARLLAMTRLGLLPIETETGRWHGIPRAERLCQLCGNCIGDTKHFLHGCERLTAERVKSLESKATYTEARGKELFF